MWHADCGESLKKVTFSAASAVAIYLELSECLPAFSERLLTFCLTLQPKVQNHIYNCSASAFNCIDCGRTFDRYTVKVGAPALKPATFRFIAEHLGLQPCSLAIMLD